MIHRRLSLLAVAALMALTLTACSKPTENYNRPTPAPTESQNPATTPQPDESVDAQIRATLTAYFEALNEGAFGKANSFWSKMSSVNYAAPDLKASGATDWHLQSVELIQVTGAGVAVQLNFDVKVTGASEYTDGRNVRFVSLLQEQGQWKIFMWQKSI